MTTLFKCRGLSIERGDKLLLSNINFEVCPGECLIVQGPNGLGKTSMLRTIAGLQPAKKGKIECNYDNIVYSSHLDGMKATLTVTENILFWISVYKSEILIEKVLEKFNLSELKDRYAGQLSAGQKRRLGLSRLYLSQRKLWVMDEPTVSLDKTAVSELISVMEEHLLDGGACIVVTHINIEIGKFSRILELSEFAPTLEDYEELSEDVFL